jgi:hypothetical protein
VLQWESYRLQAADKARSYFKDAPNVTVVDDVPIDDGWTRDWGPSVRICWNVRESLSGARTLLLTASMLRVVIWSPSMLKCWMQGRCSTTACCGLAQWRLGCSSPVCGIARVLMSL